MLDKKERDKQWKQKHPEYFKKWKAEHREYFNEYAKARYKETRECIIEILGAECVSCGINDKRCLQIDHINGGGKREIMTLGYKQMLCYYLRNMDLMKERLQILCANCNWIKRHGNYKESGGKREGAPYS